jgi:hypothetical protein
MLQQAEIWIASRSLSSGAHPRDPLARNDAAIVVLKAKGPRLTVRTFFFLRDAGPAPQKMFANST